MLGHLRTPYNDVANANALVLYCRMGMAAFGVSPCLTASIDLDGSGSTAVYSAPIKFVEDSFTVVPTVPRVQRRTITGA